MDKQILVLFFFEFIFDPRKEKFNRYIFHIFPRKNFLPPELLKVGIQVARHLR